MIRDLQPDTTVRQIYRFRASSEPLAVGRTRWQLARAVVRVRR
jgi:hypothetical protein